MVTKLTLEYDGAGFAGWGRQPGLRTVQEELERALRTVLGETGRDGRPLTLTVAGRTDRGVHAWGQVASYAHEAVDPLRLNGLLDADVAVLRAEPAPEGFDARRDALSRTYCYRVLARRARSVFTRDTRVLVDRRARPRARSTSARRCCSASTTSPRSRRRETEHSWFQLRRRARRVASATASTLEFWIEADMFLRHMNRVLVGTMLDVASGRRDGRAVRAACSRAARARRPGRTAPAHGLALASVAYA